VVNSIKKGKCFERDVVKLLSDSFGFAFKRVPNSGGFATSEKVKDFRFLGDVFTENKVFNSQFDVGIECKITRKVINLDDLCRFWKGERGLLSDWISQCKKEFLGHNFWLVFKYFKSSEFIIRGIWNGSGYDVRVVPLLFSDFLLCNGKF